MRRTVGWWMGARTHRDHRIQIVLELGGRVVLGDAREVRVRARPRGDAPASEREVVALSLSRDCARRNKERVGRWRTRRNGWSVSARARSRFERVDNTVARESRVSSPGAVADARAPGPGQSRDRFRSRPRKYSKKPRRRSGRRRTRGDPAARTDSGRGARHRGSARALVRREDASRGRARPRGRARSGRGQRANGTERDRHRGGWRFRARRGDAARFEPGDATRANAREAAGGTERSETAATGASRACYSGNDGACVCASADAFSKPFVEFCREKFVRASFSDATSGRPLASPEDFFAASPSEI